MLPPFRVVLTLHSVHFGCRWSYSQ